MPTHRNPAETRPNPEQFPVRPTHCQLEGRWPRRERPFGRRVSWPRRGMGKNGHVAFSDLADVTEQLTGIPSSGPYVSIPLEQLMKLLEMAATSEAGRSFVLSRRQEGVRLGASEFRHLWRHAISGQQETVHRTVTVEDLLLLL